MPIWLAPQVCAASVEGDIVFLDIASDAYLCLVEGGADIALQAGGGVEPRSRQIADDLLAAGLIAEAPAMQRPKPPPVLRGLDAAAAPASIGRLASALRVNRKAARAVTRRSFAEVLGLAGPLDARAFDPPGRAILAEAARFARLAPWLPRTGLCLMRSLQQRLYLSARGHAAAWVFGVRTWPFEAHCWLQAGDVVLDDSPAHVGGFTPILVV